VIDPQFGRWVVDDVGVRSVLDALPRAVFVIDAEGRILLWNRQAEGLYGWGTEEVSGRSVADVLVSLQGEDLAVQIFDSLHTGEAWEGDFGLVGGDGDPVRVWMSGRPVVDEVGDTVAIVAVSEDVSERRLLEQRDADLTERLRLALEAGRLGTFRLDLATGLIEWDTRLEALFGLPPDHFEGTFEAWVSLVHPEDRPRVLRTLEDAVVERAPFSVEHRVVWPEGSVHWLHSSGQLVLDEDGCVTGAIGCTRDVTEHVVVEQERQRLTLEAVRAADRERIHRQRLEVLAGITDAVASGKDRREVMVNVAKAAVPRLGDWCSIYVLPHPRATVPDIETAHVDPAMVELARALQERFPYDPESPVGMPRVIRTGTAQFLPAIDEAVMDELGVSDAKRAIVRDLELSSAIGVPLIKNGKVLGGLQFVMTKSNRTYTRDDLTLIEAVASRVASNLENRRLSEEQRSIASTLQASLLPQQLPPIPGLDIAVRYWASGDGVEVGGDFYDLFRVSDDQWAVVIGDVCGKGPGAAAVTGLVRHTIASAAWHGDDHVSVLRNLNRAILERAPDAFCTAVYGTLQPRADSWSFTYVCGGHPPPILVRADGSPLPPGRYGSLIGALPDIDVATTTALLYPGDVAVLYTDGVTDVAPPNDITDQRFSQLVARAALETSSADELADRLQTELSSILAIDKRDDIALMILRLPRTPEVG
jgi:PAS domain S-box-containing protein